MSGSLAVENSGAEIWGRLVLPGRGTLAPEAARALLGLQISRDDHERVAVLDAKAQAGALTAEEAAELDEYIRVSEELAVIKAKARLSLRVRASTPDDRRPFLPQTARYPIKGIIGYST